MDKLARTLLALLRMDGLGDARVYVGLALLLVLAAHSAAAGDYGCAAQCAAAVLAVLGVHFKPKSDSGDGKKDPPADPPSEGIDMPSW